VQPYFEDKPLSVVLIRGFDFGSDKRKDVAETDITQWRSGATARWMDLSRQLYHWLNRIGTVLATAKTAHDQAS
jgi:hypothetical protein